MISGNEVQAELEYDDVFWRLWRCDSWEELRLTAAALGIDVDRWLKNEGWMWRRIYEGRR